jgi:phosphinothricin acetyltransferase
VTENLRVGTLDDVTALARLATSEEFGRWIPEPPNFQSLEASFLIKISTALNGKGRILVAETVGEIVGYAAILFGSKKAYLEYGVAYDHQGRGLGKRLVGKLLQEPLHAPMKSCVAVCHVDNHASLRILETYGFQNEGSWQGTSPHYAEFVRHGR